MTPFDSFTTRLMQQAGRMKSGAAMMAVVALAGCATTAAQNEKDAAGVATPPLEVTTEISEVANSINAHLSRLAEIEASAKKFKPAPRPKISSGPLTERTSVLWRSGPAEEILYKIATGVGYTFRMVGSAPPEPLLVKIDVTDEPIVDILRSIGLQLGDKAMVDVNTETKSIEVIYASGR